MTSISQPSAAPSPDTDPPLRTPSPRTQPPPAEPSRDARWWARVWPWLGASVWLGLTSWKLTSVPGMSMDEGWSIVSARGQWPAANPLSGLTPYSGPFPVLLVKIFGGYDALLALRGASVLANGLMLVLIARLLARLHPTRVLRGWALILIASCPVWLVALRTGIEVLMLMPFLTVLGLYLLSRRTRWAAFGAGLVWGLLVYNHLIGLAFPVALGFAWLAVYWRLPGVPLLPFVAGLALGLLPRVISIALYGTGLEAGGSASRYSFQAAVSDLRWLPKAAWETLIGETVYLRYCGTVMVEIWPYWVLAVALLVPWLRRPWRIPRAAWFLLLASVASAVISTLLAPYMGVRFFVLPLVGFSTFLVVLGAAAIERDARWRHLVRPVALALAACNLAYVGANFYWPWEKHQLGITSFFLGERSARTTSWGYLPKKGLVRTLRNLSPRPAQVISNATIDRPLRAMLDGTGMRACTWDEADATLPSVFIDYDNGYMTPERCMQASNGNMCFHDPKPVNRYFLLYQY